MGSSAELPVLRGNQWDVVAKIDAEWLAGNRAVFLVASTGFGKTVVLSHLISREPGLTLSLAHRRELIGQLSMAHARNGVRHRIVGPKSLIQKIVRKHMKELGRSYYDPNGRTIVASVQSVDTDAAWFGQITLVIGDEGHHYLADNSFGAIIAACPADVRMVFPTATCFRADGKGLGRHSDGFGDVMVFAEGFRKLVRDGYLLDYDIGIARPLDYQRPDDAELGASGEFKKGVAAESVHKSKQIVGDIVKTYRDLCPGKLALAFTADIPAAIETAAAFKAAGIAAEVVTGTTDPDLRDRIFERFAERQILVIVNVGIAGEGTDIPGVEVVIMAAPIGSQGWFDQVFGRGARLNISRDLMRAWDTFSRPERLAHIAASPKPRFLVIDHCGNVEVHLPPDGPRHHTLDRRDKRARKAANDAIPYRLCLECAHPTPMIHEPTDPDTGEVCDYCPTATNRTHCRACGADKPTPAGGRGAPEQVDGVVRLLDPEALAALRDAIVEAETRPYVRASVVGEVINHNFGLKLEALQALRKAMALWAGWRTVLGDGPDDRDERFWRTFGTDKLTAQTLDRGAMAAMTEKINKIMLDGGVSEA